MCPTCHKTIYYKYKSCLNSAIKSDRKRCRYCQNYATRKGKKLVDLNPKRKHCNDCGQIKKISNFYKNRSRPDGFCHICKRCEWSRREERLKTDIQYKLIKILRIRLNKALGCNQKVGSAIQELGCTVYKLKIHLEKQFYPNSETGELMTWNNHGLYGWHIDHIIPLSKFDLTNKAQLKKACHYTNLQPMWAKENLNKSNKIK